MSAAPPQPSRVRFEGPVTVRVIGADDAVMNNLRIHIYILIGPTGSGKSSFIESVSPDQPLSISKDSLDSVTQSVVPYALHNVVLDDHPIVLVDTPGFLDTRLSESNICEMIRDWINSMPKKGYKTVKILYFERITDIRMAGRKQRSIQLLKEWIGARPGDSTFKIAVVSTMWNQLETTRQIENANRKLEELERFFKGREQILKFECTQKSALDVLDQAYEWRITVIVRPKREPYRLIAMQSLYERLGDVELQLQQIEEDLRTTTKFTMQGRSHRKWLRKRLKDTEDIKASFYRDLSHFDPDVYPPLDYSPNSPNPSIRTFWNLISGIRSPAS